MKRSFKTACAVLLALCMVMALMPTAFIGAVAANGSTYSIEVAHIFEGDTQNNYTEQIINNSVGDTVLLAVEAPYGYEIEDVYFTTAAGSAFTEYIEDLDYDNPISGVYHITMPAMDIKANVVYRSIIHGVTINNIYGVGEYDDMDFSNDAGDYEEGYRVSFWSNPAEGYVVDQIIFTTLTDGGAFEEIIDIDYWQVDVTTYEFFMPDTDVNVNIIYRDTTVDINPVYFFENGDYIQGDFYDGPLNAVPGQVVYFTDLAPENHVLTEVYATYAAGSAFVEAIEFQQLGDVYYFVMPEENVTIFMVYANLEYDITVENIFVDGVVDTANYYSGAASAIVGDDVYFTVEAPDGYAVSEVYATSEAGDAFVEAVAVDGFAGGYYFTMPADDVTVSVVFKPSKFDINFTIYIDDVFVESYKVSTASVGNKTGGSLPYYDGCVVEDVIITYEASEAFEELVDYEIVNDMIFFEMPEGDVNIIVNFKENLFDVNIHTYIDGSGYDHWSTEDYEAGTEYTFAVAPPAGYIVEDVIAVTTAVGPFEEIIPVNKLGENYYSLVMPEGDVTINVIYKAVLYDVTVETYYDGELLTTDYSVDQLLGSTYIYTADTDGYKVESIVATTEDGTEIPVVAHSDSVYSFEVVDSDIKVEVKLVSSEINVNVSFVDVDGELLYLDSITTYADELIYVSLKSNGYIATEYYLYTENGPFFEVYDDYTVRNSTLYINTPDTDLMITLVVVPDEFDVTVNFIANENEVIDVQSFVYPSDDTAVITVKLEGYDVNEIFFTALQGAFGEPIEFEYHGNDIYSFKMPQGAVTIDAYVERSTVDVILPQGEGYTFIVDGTAPLYGDDYSFKVEFDESYDSENVVIKANGEKLVSTNGVYTIENVTETVYVTVEGGIATKVYNVTFNYFDGDTAVKVTNSVIRGTAAIAPTNTYRYTYNFLGWFDNAEGTGEAVSDFSNVTADAEYYAVYERNPVASYTFGEYTVTDSPYGIGFKQISMKVVKDNAEYQDREVFAVIAAQVKDGSTVLFYVPVEFVAGEATADISIILNTNTFTYADMYLVYDEVDLSGALNWVDIEAEIQLG